MKLIVVFILLSSVSAAFWPILARQMALECNRKILKGYGNVPELQESFKPYVSSSSLEYHDISPLHYLLPVSYCDSIKNAKESFKRRLNAEKVRYFISTLETPPQNFDWRNYERMLVTRDHSKILEAYKKGSIDFSYVPRKERFDKVLLDMNSTEGNAIIQKYFEFGAFEEMRQMGLVKYTDIIESAILRNNYFVAHLALDYMIAAMKKEIDSEDFEKYKWRINEDYFVNYGLQHVEQLPIGKIVASWYRELSENEKEMLQFYGKYNRVFVETPLKHWKIESSMFVTRMQNLQIVMK